jgi:uncharacterized protein DUF5343
MALPRSYLTSTKNLAQIFDSIKAAQAPEKFTIKFLESLDFKSTSDRLIIGVLKSLGLLSVDNARPTERYFRFLDQTQSAAVLAEGIREAYSDLFQVNKNANTLTKSDVTNKMKTLGEGQFSESVLDKMALTFVELCKLADFFSQTIHLRCSSIGRLRRAATTTPYNGNCRSNESWRITLRDPNRSTRNAR